mmetsp:Transcript_26596/g.47782  ORF Transcript_26596/g.47782 Transcript_26596/m.47782 type:complete len:258 (-) Transcript_26596:2661-3434(-)
MSAHFCTASLRLNFFLISQKYLQFLSVTYLCYYFLLHSHLVIMHKTWFKGLSISLLINIIVVTGLLTLSFYTTKNASTVPPCKQLFWMLLHASYIYPPTVLFIVSYRVSNKLRALQAEAKLIVMGHRRDLLWALFLLVLVVSFLSIAHNFILYFSPSDNCDHYFVTKTSVEEILNAMVYFLCVYITDFSVVFLLLYIFWEKKPQLTHVIINEEEAEIVKALKIRGFSKTSQNLELSPTSSSRFINWPVPETEQLPLS